MKRLKSSTMTIPAVSAGGDLASISGENAALTRIIANLTETNRQLTSVHCLTLGRLESVYSELNACRNLGLKQPKNRSRPRNNRSLGRSKVSIRVSTSPSVEVDDATITHTETTCQTTQTHPESPNDAENLLEIERLSRQLQSSEVESARLLDELETFRKVSSAAQERIGALESLKREEADKSARLATKLTEETSESRKLTIALEDARKEISSLREIIESKTSREDVEPDGDDNDTTNPGSSSKSSKFSLEEFEKELLLKREARQRAIAAVSSEIERLKAELEAERLAHQETMRQLAEARAQRQQCDVIMVSSPKTDGRKTDNNSCKTQEQVEAMRLSDLLKISDEIMSDLRLQLERTDDMRFQLENEPNEHRLRIISLKRLSDGTRDMIKSRKKQINVLKDRLAQILVRLGDRNFLDTNDDIREELDRQIEDISRSRNLSDERFRILAELKDHSQKELHEVKVKMENGRKNIEGLEEELQKTEEKLDTRDGEILNLESQLGLTKADCRDLQNQMSVINSLFTQMLLSASSAEMDLDRLTQLLQENHDLISEITKQNGTEAAALPKLLLDIIKQVDGPSATDDGVRKDEDDSQEENIANNLPKVWRVLMELLSCHAASSTATTTTTTSTVPATAEPDSTATSSGPDSCYKSVDTPAGPRLVISVSKTYIRLKELILEKKHLEKEMNRMKQLNTHLESKLSEQEKRLLIVSDELSKTWNIVGRMQAQHQQLHTHEKILRYELQQKRKMLQELKQELEYCREKWESARQKNSKTEVEWRSLRREFAARKAMANHSDPFNQSAESGFSDEREEESDEEDLADDDVDNNNSNGSSTSKRPRAINSRRRSRKDDSRSTSPETESEQPTTDNETSESKTGSSINSELLMSPEAEEDLENPEVNEDDGLVINTLATSPECSSEENLNSLDKALTNVIRNLITIEQPCGNTSSQDELEEDEPSETNDSNTLQESVQNSISTEPESSQLPSTVKDQSTKEIIQKCDLQPCSSIFSIGPFSGQVKNVQFSDPLVVGPSNGVLSSTPKDIDNTSTLSVNIDSCAEDSKTETNVPSQPPDVIDTTLATSISKKSSSDNPSSSSNETPSPSAPSSSQPQIDNRTPEEVLDARAARLKSLEEQAEWLVKRMNATNRRGTELSTRLGELHETYGSVPTPPPIPDVLPNLRIQTQNNSPSSEQENQGCNENSPRQQP